MVGHRVVPILAAALALLLSLEMDGGGAPVAAACTSAPDIGTVPPDYDEPDGLLAPGENQWRTLSTAQHRLRIEVAGDPFGPTTVVDLHSGCRAGFGVGPARLEPSRNLADGAWIYETPCVGDGRYWLELRNDDPSVPASFRLSIVDLGACARPTDFLARATAIRDHDGDLDGFPDSGETVEVALAVRNRSPFDLTGVVARISSSDPRLVCVSPSSLSIGSLPAGTEAAASSPVRFTVNPRAERGGNGVTCVAGSCSNFQPVAKPFWLFPQCASDADCRRGANQTYDAALDLEISAAELASASQESVRVELDLDSAHPAMATSTFAEGFESGFVSFVLQNLDDGRASNDLSQGYRCQQHNPNRPGCGAVGCQDPCYLGFADGQDPVNAWHVHDVGSPDGGRAFLGARSAHYGTHVAGNPGADTYQLSQLDALRSTAGIRLAARVCRDDPAPDPRACVTDLDCAAVSGGPCVVATPRLSIKHQVSTVDSRSTTTSYERAVDRAVVQARVTGTGTWRTLAPFVNQYDAQASNDFSNCAFDPVDDGNDENLSFPDADPFALVGPSSTCFPEFAFSWLGDTDAPFSPTSVGQASDGPGLAGAVGTGTWVESVFDLSALRGRRLELRFLFTSLKVFDFPTHGDLWGWNPIADDDGWYVDDVRVTQTLGATSPTATLDESAPVLPASDADADGVADSCDNCPAQANADQRDRDRDGVGDVCDPDRDGDGTADAGDCDPASASAWTAPGPARDLRVEGGAPTLLRWDPPLSPGATELWYDVVTTGDPPDLDPAACAAESSSLRLARDLGPDPVVGAPRFYVVVAANRCGRHAGFGSSGSARPVPHCP